MQELLAQIQDVAQTVAATYQIPIEDMEKLFLASPVARINWAGQWQTLHVTTIVASSVNKIFYIVGNCLLHLYLGHYCFFLLFF